MTTTIQRKESFSRTWYVEGKAIRQIKFYLGDTVLLETSSGWIEGEYRDALGLVLKQPVRRSTKLNLSKGGHFFISAPKNYNRDPEVCLYVDIAVGDVSVGDEIDVVQWSDHLAQHVCKQRSVTADFMTGAISTILVNVSSSMRAIYTPYGAKVESISKSLKEAGVGTLPYGLLEHLITNRALITDLTEANQLFEQAKPTAKFA